MLAMSSCCSILTREMPCNDDDRDDEGGLYCRRCTGQGPKAAGAAKLHALPDDIRRSPAGSLFIIGNL